MPHNHNGFRADRLFYPRNDREFSRPPLQNIINDTRKLYYDGGSEISFDGSNEDPKALSRSIILRSTTETMPSLSTFAQIQEEYVALPRTLSAPRHNVQPPGEHLLKSDRDFAYKKNSNTTLIEEHSL